MSASESNYFFLLKKNIIPAAKTKMIKRPIICVLENSGPCAWPVPSPANANVNNDSCNIILSP